MLRWWDLFAVSRVSEKKNPSFTFNREKKRDLCLGQRLSFFQIWDKSVMAVIDLYRGDKKVSLLCPLSVPQLITGVTMTTSTYYFCGVLLYYFTSSVLKVPTGSVLDWMYLWAWAQFNPNTPHRNWKKNVYLGRWQKEEQKKHATSSWWEGL